jgi:hypothetical protein
MVYSTPHLGLDTSIAQGGTGNFSRVPGTYVVID